MHGRSATSMFSQGGGGGGYDGIDGCQAVANNKTARSRQHTIPRVLLLSSDKGAIMLLLYDTKLPKRIFYGTTVFARLASRSAS